MTLLCFNRLWRLKPFPFVFVVWLQTFVKINVGIHIRNWSSYCCTVLPANIFLRKKERNIPVWSNCSAQIIRTGLSWMGYEYWTTSDCQSTVSYVSFHSCLTSASVSGFVNVRISVHLKNRRHRWKFHHKLLKLASHSPQINGWFNSGREWIFLSVFLSQTRVWMTSYWPDNCVQDFGIGCTFHDVSVLRFSYFLFLDSHRSDAM